MRWGNYERYLKSCVCVCVCVWGGGGGYGIISKVKAMLGMLRWGRNDQDVTISCT